MRAVFHPPASIVSVVEAPRAVSSLARPTRPLWPVDAPFDAGGRAAAGRESARDALPVEAAEDRFRRVRAQP